MEVNQANLESVGYKSYPPHVHGAYCTAAYSKTFRDESCFGLLRKWYGDGDKMFFIHFMFHDIYDSPTSEVLNEKYRWKAESCMYQAGDVTFKTEIYLSTHMHIEQVEDFFMQMWKSMNCILDPHNNP